MNKFIHKIEQNKIKKVFEIIAQPRPKKKKSLIIDGIAS